MRSSICDALIDQRDAEIAMSPGFRWGTTVPSGQAITVEDLHNATSMTYPQAYRSEMSGALIKEILEDCEARWLHVVPADALFEDNGDPFGGPTVLLQGLTIRDGYSLELRRVSFQSVVQAMFSNVVFIQTWP